MSKQAQARCPGAGRLTLHVDLVDGLGTGSPKHVHQSSCVDDHVGSGDCGCHLVGLGYIPLDGCHLHRSCVGVRDDQGYVIRLEASDQQPI